MLDIGSQTADGKVLWHFGMSLDGYVADKLHDGTIAHATCYWAHSFEPADSRAE